MIPHQIPSCWKNVGSSMDSLQDQALHCEKNVGLITPVFKNTFLFNTLFASGVNGQ